MEAAGSPEPDGRFFGVYPKQFERLVWVLREKYPRVLAANRRFEEETGFENEYGQNNLADALSHVGTLLAEAHSLSEERQAGQVTLFEDHFRRAMMESWEQLLDFQLGEIDELWETYLEDARPLQAAHKLEGAPTDKEIDRLRIRHKHLLDAGREAKRAGDWDGWEHGTDSLIQACETAARLHHAVEQSIAAAHGYRRQEERDRRERRRDRRQVAMWAIGLLISGAIGGAGLVFAITDDESAKPPSPEQQEQQRAPGGAGR